MQIYKSLLKKKFIVFFVAVIVGGGIIFAIAQLRDNATSTNSTSQSDDDEAQPEESINLTPPTPEDAQRVEENKQAIIDRENKEKNTTPPPAGAKKAVKPIITYAGQYGSKVEVGGYTTGVFESGATCVVAFSKDGQGFSKSVTAVTNVNSMDCPVVEVPASEFSSKGSWTVTITYDSASANGTSDTKVIEIT
jgi:hypothetical protein